MMNMDVVNSGEGDFDMDSAIEDHMNEETSGQRHPYKTGLTS